MNNVWLFTNFYNKSIQFFCSETMWIMWLGIKKNQLKNDEMIYKKIS